MSDINGKETVDLKPAKENINTNNDINQTSESPENQEIETGITYVRSDLNKIIGNQYQGLDISELETKINDLDSELNELENKSNNDILTAEEREDQKTKQEFIQSIADNFSEQHKDPNVIYQNLLYLVKNDKKIVDINDIPEKELKKFEIFYEGLSIKQLQEILEKRKNELYLTENNPENSNAIRICNSIEESIILSAIEKRKKIDANIANIQETSENNKPLKDYQKYEGLNKPTVDKFPVVVKNDPIVGNNNSKKNESNVSEEVKKNKIKSNDFFIDYSNLTDFPEDKKNKDVILKPTITPEGLSELYNSDAWGISELKNELNTLKKKLEDTDINNLTNIANIRLHIDVIKNLIKKLENKNKTVNGKKEKQEKNEIIYLPHITEKESEIIGNIAKLLTYRLNELTVVLDTKKYSEKYNITEDAKREREETELEIKNLQNFIKNFERIKNLDIESLKNLSLEALNIILKELEEEYFSYSISRYMNTKQKDNNEGLGKKIKEVGKIIENKEKEELIENYTNSEKNLEDFKKLITNFHFDKLEPSSWMDKINTPEILQGKIPMQGFDLPRRVINIMEDNAFKEANPKFSDKPWVEQKLHVFKDFKRVRIKERLDNYKETLEQYINIYDYDKALKVIQEVYSLVEEYSPKKSIIVLKTLNPLYENLENEKEEMKELEEKFNSEYYTEKSKVLGKRLKDIKNPNNKSSFVEKKVIEKILEERKDEYNQGIGLDSTSITIEDLENEKVELSHFFKDHEKYSFLLGKGIKFLKEYFEFYYKNKKVEMSLAKETVTREITHIAKYIVETYSLNPELAKEYLKTIKKVKVLRLSLDLLSSEYKELLKYIEHSPSNSKNLIPEKLTTLDENKSLPDLSVNEYQSINETIKADVDKLEELIEFEDPHLAVSFYKKLMEDLEKSSSKDFKYLLQDSKDKLKKVAIFLNNSGQYKIAKDILINIGLKDTIKTLPSVISYNTKFKSRDNQASKIGVLMGEKKILTNDSVIYNPPKEVVESRISKLLENIENPIVQTAVEKNIAELLSLDPKNEGYEFLSFVYDLSPYSTRTEKEKMEILKKFIKNKDKYLSSLDNPVVQENNIYLHTNKIKDHDINVIDRDNIEAIINSISFSLPENIKKLIIEISNTYKSTDEIKELYTEEYQADAELTPKEKAEYNIILKFIEEEDFDNIKEWYQNKLKKKLLGFGNKKLHIDLAKKIYYLAISYGDTEFASQVQEDFKLKNIIVDKQTEEDIRESRQNLIEKKLNKPKELVNILRKAIENSEGVNRFEYMFKLIESIDQDELSEKDVDILEDIFDKFQQEVTEEIKEKYMTQEKRLLKFNKAVDVLPPEYEKLLNDINKLNIKNLSKIEAQRLRIMFKVLMKDNAPSVYKDIESTLKINEELRNKTKESFLAISSIEEFDKFKNDLKTTEEKIALAELLEDKSIHIVHKILIKYLIGDIRTFNEDKVSITNLNNYTNSNEDQNAFKILISIQNVSPNEIKKSDPFVLTPLSYMSEDSKRTLEALNDYGGSPMFMVEEAIKIYSEVAEQEKSQSFFAYESVIALFMAETYPVRNISQESVDMVLKASSKISQKSYDEVIKRIYKINEFNVKDESIDTIACKYSFNENETIENPLEFSQNMSEEEKNEKIKKAEDLISAFAKQGRFVEMRVITSILKEIDKNNTTAQILTIYLTALDYYKSIDNKEKKECLKQINEKTNYLVEKESLETDDPLYRYKAELLDSLKSATKKGRLCLLVNILEKYLKVSTDINEINPDNKNPFLTTEMKVDFSKNDITTSELKVLIEGMENGNFEEQNSIKNIAKEKVLDGVKWMFRQNNEYNTIPKKHKLLKLYFVTREDAENLYPHEQNDFFIELKSYAQTKEKEFIKNGVNQVAEKFKIGKKLTADETLFYAFYGDGITPINKLTDTIKLGNKEILITNHIKDIIDFPKIIIPEANNS